jgi:arylsulfatase A-like enzyme
MDLLPTVCDLVGAPAPADLDGKSLKPIMDGKSKAVRDTLFYAYRDVQRAVRDERWKLILYPRINKRQLFDLANDPDELHDLSADPAHARRIEPMTAKLREWQRQMGDTTPLTSPAPQDPTFTPPSGEELNAARKSWQVK